MDYLTTGTLNFGRLFWLQIALEELSERVNGDMRMALNQLQYMSLRSQVLNYADIRTRLMASAKDEDVTPFSAMDKSVLTVSDYIFGIYKWKDVKHLCNTAICRVQKF